MAAWNSRIAQIYTSPCSILSVSVSCSAVFTFGVLLLAPSMTHESRDTTSAPLVAYQVDIPLTCEWKNVDNVGVTTGMKI